MTWVVVFRKCLQRAGRKERGSRGHFSGTPQSDPPVTSVMSEQSGFHVDLWAELWLEKVPGMDLQNDFSGK